MTDAIPVKLADGREFPSIIACARAIGIKHCTLLWRLEHGLTPFTTEPVGKPWGIKKRKKTYFLGKIYPSLTAAAQAHGISIATVSQAVKRQRREAL